MGLDWHSQIRMTKEEREEWVQEYMQEELQQGHTPRELMEDAPKYKVPCSVVGAPRMKERATFVEDMKEEFNYMKERAQKQKENTGQFRNDAFIAYWEGRTIEEEIMENSERFDCKNCPFLKELQGADSSNSAFLGITVSSCDFRGKMIGSDMILDENIRDDAYEPHSPDGMLDYADDLEYEIEELRDSGYLEKEPYKDYVEEHNRVTYPGKEPLLSEEDYLKLPHWRERNLRQAIHWLRTCAAYGVSMGTSY